MSVGKNWAETIAWDIAFGTSIGLTETRELSDEIESALLKVHDETIEKTNELLEAAKSVRAFLADTDRANGMPHGYYEIHGRLNRAIDALVPRG